MKNTLFIFLLLFIITNSVISQEMDFESYNPPSTLVVPEHIVTKAKFPFIDVHNHQRLNNRDLSGLVNEMNDLNMKVMINLSGKRGGIQGLQDGLKNVKENYPNRFITFTNIDFSNIDDHNWSQNAAKILEADVKAGANGLKIFKSLGLRHSDKNGNRIAVDDPRIDAVWAKCGELGIPVLIHAADPKPFWSPHDDQNERWLELKLRSGRKRSDTDPAPWETIIAEQHNVFRKHPNTKFINAHLGWFGNNLDKLSELMDTYPNMYSEIGAVIAELGRQPRRAKAFLTKYQDRVMFGKDSYRKEE
ncbi:MAG: putative TIM-barrel fold metal-dependent hydrolase, partial [Bacteroidia bacterium]